jgi:ribosomal protein S18 acetylase RimI-like enzyme
MSKSEFDGWHAKSVESFAQDLARAVDRPLDAARSRAAQQFAEWLPDGLDTPGTWLMTIRDGDDAVVGHLWVGPHPDRAGAAFVYDIEIDEGHRGHGLGRAAMLAAERLVAEAGIAEIGLSVFGFNEAAQRLYTSLGYRVLATQMAKKLG